MQAVDLSRHLNDDVREVDLRANSRLTWSQLEHVASDYSARTLVKRDGLRVVLIVMEDGAEIAPHRADGDLTVQVLSGKVVFRVNNEEFVLDRGKLLSVARGLFHDLMAVEDSELLLTLSR